MGVQVGVVGAGCPRNRISEAVVPDGVVPGAVSVVRDEWTVQGSTFLGLFCCQGPGQGRGYG